MVGGAAVAGLNIATMGPVVSKSLPSGELEFIAEQVGLSKSELAVFRREILGMLVLLLEEMPHMEQNYEKTLTGLTVIMRNQPTICTIEYGAKLDTSLEGTKY